MKKHMKKWTLLFISMILVVSVLAACAGKGNETGTNNTAQTEKPDNTAGTVEEENPSYYDDGSEKFEITFLVESWGGGKWRDDHPTLKFLEEKFNVELKIDWTDGPTYTDKLNVLAASGSLPDMYRIHADTFAKWQSEDIFMDLAPHLENYPNLAAAFPEEQYAMLNPEGKIYGIPWWEVAVRDSYQIRADWLRNVGLPIPDPETFTVDDFYEIVRAFAFDDPNKSGKRDTIGFSTDQEIAGNAIQLKAAFGLANGWKLVDGKLIPQYLQVDEQKAYLTYLRKMFEEGILDQEFLSKKGGNVYEGFQAGRTGIWNSHPLGLRTDNEKLKAIDPNAELIQLAPPIGPNGDRGNGTRLNGSSKIIINGTIDEKKQQRILKLLDWWVTDEGTDVMKSGIEGEHYTKNADGTYTETELIETDLPRIFNNWFFKRADPNLGNFRWTDPAIAEFDATFNENAAKYPWMDESQGLSIYSETFATQWNILHADFVAAQVKIVYGQEPLDSIDKAIEAWKAGGGDKIIQEMNDAYEKYGNK